ncbi:hypothetical protein [Mesorhizobium sp. ES1-1]|uniref:hypothetical protein n=1 Tax=Mesorhizobium sp. ES1-1 TaxID=2876629 RepID=UPI001CCFC481|nr:hypothetical protein [Mesorhizobium sp. ES1-1]MBZ9678279.1 hypothetical protein [Mesorhizobium sp. ES1-1]
MNERLTVRSAYQRGWQVVDGSTILETFPAKEEAFQFLVDRGARVRLQWGRTVIGGRTAPYDFSAAFQSDNAGRIRMELHPPSKGLWLWYQSSSRGAVEAKDRAIFEVERAYTRLMCGADLPR